jgi:DNA (cytosine-5)-methyltransferase 1
MGLDLGLERAGFVTRVAVECNGDAVQTLKINRPELPVISRKIENVTTAEILEIADLRRGEATVVTGGPSCQPFSTAGRRGSVGDPRGVMFEEFCRVVREARPRFFVMENVTGVLSAAVSHRPLSRRGPGHPILAPEEELGSALLMILRELGSLGYHVIFDVLNAADYGVPQRRQRVLFLGSRDNERLVIPAPTHAETPKAERSGWRTLRDAVSSLNDDSPLYPNLTEREQRFLRLVPQGGNWRDLPVNVRAEAMGAAYHSWGGRVGFCRRLSWDRPAPALTTVPDGRATMLCHPTELRPLSVREYARLQQFPDTWKFEGSLYSLYRQIGNAFPLGVGEAVGRALRATMRRRTRVVGRGVVACASERLLNRLACGYRTRLNPPRLRCAGTEGKVRAWTEAGGSAKKRAEILSLAVTLGDVRIAPKRFEHSAHQANSGRRLGTKAPARIGRSVRSRSR